MDRDAFEGLTKALAASPSRRRALSAGEGLLLARGGAPVGATAPQRRTRWRRPGSGDCESVPPGGCDTLWSSCRAVLDDVFGPGGDSFAFDGCCQQLGDASKDGRGPIVLNDVCLEKFYCPHASAAASPSPSAGQSYDGPCANLGPKCEQSLPRWTRAAATRCCVHLATCEVGQYVRCLIDRHVLCPPPG